jgi:putative transcriptional regulator
MEYSNDEDGLAGKILIAMPGIDDERFARAVILICAHNDEHAMGIVLNRAMGDLTLPELLDQLDVPIEIEPPEDPVLVGGPVGKDRGFVIHTEDFESIGATIPIGNGLRLTATKEVLQAIASDECPARCRLALGYSGWGPLQLESELKENVWLVAEADSEIVFDSDFDGKWERAINMLGISSSALQGGPAGHA